MREHISIPKKWNIPESIRGRVAEVPGAQRAIEAEGHLVLILHSLPTVDRASRDIQMFWRDPQGAWVSDEFKTGIGALQQLVTDYNQRVSNLEDLEHRATSADDYFLIRREITSIHRAAKNLAATIARAYEMFPDDRGLLACRNLSGTVERTSELLKDDATYGLEYTMAKQSESQAVASHRLNLIAATFFPIMAFAAVFGMNLDHGLEHQSVWLFWLFVAFGIMIGLAMKSVVLRSKIEKPTRAAPATNRPLRQAESRSTKAGRSR